MRDQRRWGGPDPPADLFSMHLIGEPYAPLADILTRMVTGHLVNRLDKCCRGRGRPKPRSPMLNVQPPNGYLHLMPQPTSRISSFTSLPSPHAAAHISGIRKGTEFNSLAQSSTASPTASSPLPIASVENSSPHHDVCEMQSVWLAMNAVSCLAFRLTSEAGPGVRGRHRRPRCIGFR